MKKENRKQLFKTLLLYTLLFVFLTVVIYSIFIKYKRSFIWNDDGYRQHFVILNDLGNMVKSFISNPSNGFKIFSWNLGLGLDVIGQYSYYALGDIFAYLSLVSPFETLSVTYTLLILLRMYCVGLSFIAFARYKKYKLTNTLIGALMYTFSAFVLYAGVRHPYFINPVILLPLLLIGVDRLLKDNKKGMFIIILFFSLISNYYFFYMLTVLVLLYALIEYLCNYRKEGIKFFLSRLFSGFISYIIAIMMSTFIFIPTIYAFLNSARSGAATLMGYDAKYYETIITGLITNDTSMWSVFGVSSIIVLFIPLLFKRRKENKTLFLCFIITTIMLCFPFFGSLMNGFSYPSNRWSFAYSFILAIIVTKLFDSKLNYTKEDIKSMIFGLLAYIGLVCIVCQSIKKEFMLMILFAIGILLLIVFKNDIEKRFKKIRIFKVSYIVIILTVWNIACMGHYLYDVQGKGYVDQFIGFNRVTDSYNNHGDKVYYYDKAIKKIKEDDSFYRISRYPIRGEVSENSSIYFDYKSISTFLSIGSKYETELALDLNNSAYSISRPLMDLDSRTKITTLLGTKYFIVADNRKQYIPFGYELIDEIETLREDIPDTQTYKNKYSLSNVLFYDNYITDKDYDSLTPLEKEQSLLDSVSLKDKPSTDIKYNEELKEVENVIDYEIDPKNGFELISDNKIITVEKNSKIKLKVNDIQNSEIYISFENIKYEPYSYEKYKEMSLSKQEEEASDFDKSKFDFKNKKYEPSLEFQITAKRAGVTRSEKDRDYRTNQYYFDNSDMLINLGYANDYSGDITISFDKVGTYTFDSIKVIAVSMDDYVASVDKLNSTKFNMTEYSDNFIKGTINNEKDGVLQLATTYSDGWSVIVDGEKKDTILVNDYFLGIELEAGEHEVIFEYHVPYHKISTILTIIGFISYIGLLIIGKLKKPLKNKKNS